MLDVFMQDGEMCFLSTTPTAPGPLPSQNRTPPAGDQEDEDKKGEGERAAQGVQIIYIASGIYMFPRILYISNETDGRPKNGSQGARFFFTFNPLIPYTKPTKLPAPPAVTRAPAGNGNCMTL